MINLRSPLKGTRTLLPATSQATSHKSQPCDSSVSARASFLKNIATALTFANFYPWILHQFAQHHAWSHPVLSCVCARLRHGNASEQEKRPAICQKRPATLLLLITFEKLHIYLRLGGGVTLARTPFWSRHSGGHGVPRPTHMFRLKLDCRVFCRQKPLAQAPTHEMR